MSVSQTVLYCRSSLLNCPFVTTVMLQWQAKKFCAELILLSQRFISRLLEFLFLRSLSCRQPLATLSKLHGRNQVRECLCSSGWWLSCACQVTSMTVVGRQLTALPDPSVSSLWHWHCCCHRAAPRWEHVGLMAVEALLCPVSSAGPGDYPRPFLSNSFKTWFPFSTLPPTQLSC